MRLKRFALLPVKFNRNWHVKVDEAKQFDLVFKTRTCARNYKKALEQSTRQLKPRIVLQESLDGYLIDDKELA